MKIVYATRSFLDYRIPVFRELGKIPGVELRVIHSSSATPASVTGNAAAELGERLVSLHGEKKIVIGDPARGLSNRWFRFPYQRGIMKAVRRERPDVLIGDGFFQWTFYLFLYRIFSRTPLVICYERTKHTERNVQWYRRLYRKVVLGFTSALCCSGRLCREYLTELGVAEAKITTGHMVVDVSVFRNQEIQNRMEKENNFFPGITGPRFLYVGSLIEKKGVRELLVAWGESEAVKRSMAGLTFVGTGYFEDELKELCIRNGIGNINFTGPLQYDKLPAVYRNADLFIIPTLEDNWSLVIPEAMASGLPVCTSVYNGCWPELVKPGINGWVFDPTDRNSITETLTAVVDSRDDLKSMGLRSQEIISEFTPESAAGSIYKAVKIALSETDEK